jgi:hypothetical protein
MTELDRSGNSAETEAIFDKLNGTSLTYTASVHFKDKSIMEALRVRAFPEGTTIEIGGMY